MDPPAPITRHLLNCAARNRHMAYFHLDLNGQVLASGGALGHQPIQTPKKGVPITDLLLFTERCIETGPHRFFLQGTGLERHGQSRNCLKLEASR